MGDYIDFMIRYRICVSIFALFYPILCLVNIFSVRHTSQDIAPIYLVFLISFQDLSILIYGTVQLVLRACGCIPKVLDLAQCGEHIGSGTSISCEHPVPQSPGLWKTPAC